MLRPRKVCTYSRLYGVSTSTCAWSHKTSKNPKKTLRAQEQDRPDIVAARASWCAELAKIDPQHLVFLDESGIDTRLTRSHARAVRGERAVGKVPWGHWQRLTVLGALGLDGVTAHLRGELWQEADIPEP